MDVFESAADDMGLGALAIDYGGDVPEQARTQVGIEVFGAVFRREHHADQKRAERLWHDSNVFPIIADRRGG